MLDKDRVAKFAQSMCRQLGRNDTIVWAAPEPLREQVSLARAYVEGGGDGWDEIFLIWEIDGRLRRQHLGRSANHEYLDTHEEKIEGNELVIIMSNGKEHRFPLSQFG